MAKEEKASWNSFTKAELIRTIKALDKRQTKLLNQVAALEAEIRDGYRRHRDDFRQAIDKLEHRTPLPPFPWEQSK